MAKMAEFENLILDDLQKIRFPSGMSQLHGNLVRYLTTRRHMHGAIVCGCHRPTLINHANQCGKMHDHLHSSTTLMNHANQCGKMHDHLHSSTTLINHANQCDEMHGAICRQVPSTTRFIN